MEWRFSHGFLEFRSTGIKLTSSEVLPTASTSKVSQRVAMHCDIPPGIAMGHSVFRDRIFCIYDVNYCIGRNHLVSFVFTALSFNG